MSPKFYRQQILELNIDDMEINVSSPAEARSTLVKLQKLQKILRQIKYNIRMDIMSIRKQYLEKIQRIQEPSKILGLFSKRRLTKDKEIDARKSLITERNRKIASYESIESMIDNYLIQIDDLIVQIEDFIEKFE